MNSKKYMVIVIEYDPKNDTNAKKAVDELKKARIITDLNCYYEGSDERIVKAVKNNLANAE